jgi:hypothetical protein
MVLGTSWMSHRDWRSIDSYDGSLALLRDDNRVVFGKRRDGQWSEFVDGQSIALRGFEPTEWAPVADDEIEAFAG